MPLFFYKVQDPYGCFSNFSPHPVTLEGFDWPTSEHYYQSQKFVGTGQDNLVARIRQAPTPEKAAALGRDPNHLVRSDWEQVKQDVMYRVVRAKFLAYPDLQEILLNTQDEVIIEDSPNDAYWGCGADHQGYNYLGKMLMRIRGELRAALKQD